MKKLSLVPVLALTLTLASIPVLHADVKTEEKGLVTLGGMLGRMMNLFGGKAAKEGVISTVAVSGDRKMNANDTHGQIIDRSGGMNFTSFGKGTPERVRRLERRR